MLLQLSKYWTGNGSDGSMLFAQYDISHINISKPFRLYLNATEPSFRHFLWKIAAIMTRYIHIAPVYCPRVWRNTHHNRRGNYERMMVDVKTKLKFQISITMTSYLARWRLKSPTHDCLLNRLFRRRSSKTSKLRVTGLCAGNSPVTGEFPAQRASNAENVSIWWRHHISPIKNRARTWSSLCLQMSKQLMVPDHQRAEQSNHIADCI